MNPHGRVLGRLPRAASPFAQAGALTPRFIPHLAATRIALPAGRASVRTDQRDTLVLMQLVETYTTLGQDAFGQLIRGISIGKLKTYQLYEGFKIRTHLAKVNAEGLRKGTVRFWSRLQEGDEELGKELAQAILVSHLDMIILVLNFLGIPHEDGFFAKDMDAKPYFTDGWESRVYDKFSLEFPAPLILFYINHLRWELLHSEQPWNPPSAIPA